CSKSPLSAKSSNSPAARSSGSPITARHDRMTARGKGLLGRVSFFEMEKEDDILLTAAGGRSQGVGKTGRFLRLRSACRPSPGKRRGAADQRISQTREGVNETAPSKDPFTAHRFTAAFLWYPLFLRPSRFTGRNERRGVRVNDHQARRRRLGIGKYKFAFTDPNHLYYHERKIMPTIYIKIRGESRGIANRTPCSGEVPETGRVLHKASVTQHCGDRGGLGCGAAYRPGDLQRSRPS